MRNTHIPNTIQSKHTTLVFKPIVTLNLFGTGALITPNNTSTNPNPTTNPIPNTNPTKQPTKQPPQPPNHNISKTNKNIPKTSPNLNPPSKTITNEILDTITKKMNQTMSQLEIPNTPKPYHIAYKITEIDVNNYTTNLNYTTNQHNHHFINLKTQIQIKSPQFNNNNFIIPNTNKLNTISTINLSLKTTPQITQHTT